MFKNYGFNLMYNEMREGRTVDKVGSQLLTYMLHYLGIYAFSRQVETGLIEAVFEKRYLPIRIAVIPNETCILMESEVYDIRGVDTADVRDVVNRMNTEQPFGNFFINGGRIYWSDSCRYGVDSEESTIEKLAHRLVTDMGELLEEIDWRIEGELSCVK